MAQVSERRAGLAWGLLGLTVVLLAGSAVIGLTGGGSSGSGLGFIPVCLPVAVGGAPVAGRTRIRLGWLFLSAGAVSAVSVFGKIYAGRPPRAELPGAAWIGWG